MKRLILGLFLLATCSVLLGACNTVEGFGKDVKKVGSEVEEHAKK
jgi:predicted small secreted protein